MARGASSTNAEDRTDAGIKNLDYLGRLGDKEFQKEIGRSLHPIDIIRHEKFPGMHVFSSDRGFIAQAVAPKIDALYPRYRVIFDPQVHDESLGWELCLSQNEVLIGCDWDEWLAYAKHQKEQSPNVMPTADPDVEAKVTQQAGQNIELFG